MHMKIHQRNLKKKIIFYFFIIYQRKSYNIIRKKIINHLIFCKTNKF